MQKQHLLLVLFGTNLVHSNMFFLSTEQKYKACFFFNLRKFVFDRCLPSSLEDQMKEQYH